MQHRAECMSNNNMHAQAFKMINIEEQKHQQIDYTLA